MILFPVSSPDGQSVIQADFDIDEMSFYFNQV